MNERYARAAIVAAFFAYVLLIRTYDLANSFLMIGEQIRDWTVALGPWSDLPLTGAPSTAGGRGFGPAYYWLLWIGRVIVGPFTSNLPHAGGIWVALLQSAADAWLLVALMRRVPVALALAMGLFIASAPFDISISGVIWNPPVAAALVKVATALALGLTAASSAWRVVAASAVAWLGVQAHLSAVFLAAPLLAAPVAQALVLKQWRRAGTLAGAIAATVIILQVPYFIARVQEPAAAAGPTAALENMARAESIQIVKSFGAVVNTTGELLVRQMNNWTFEWLVLGAAAIVMIRWRTDLALLAITVGPILTATALFSTWTRGYDSYWFLTATTAMVLTFGFAIAALPSPGVSRWTAVALLAGILIWQPARLEASKAFFRYPQYRAMRLGSIDLATRATVLRDIRVTFEVHPTMDKYFIYTILGGRMDPAAAERGFIDADGSARVE